MSRTNETNGQQKCYRVISFDVVCAVASSKANLLSTRNASACGMSFRSDDGNGMKLVPNMSIALSQNVAEGLMPVANYPGMWAASYNDELKTSRCG